MFPGLTVLWISEYAGTWNLTTGDRGVYLAESLSDLGLSRIEHSHTDDGQWASETIHNAAPSLAIRFAENINGLAYYKLRDLWWSVANKAGTEGTLRIIRPDNTFRDLRCRLRDTPDVTYLHDPGKGVSDRPTEPWLLIGDSPYWSGPTQTLTYQKGVRDRSEVFYGVNNKWPLSISEYGSTSSDWVRNRGDGAMFLKWRIRGPIENPVFGYGDGPGGLFTYAGLLEEGEEVVIETQPGRVSVHNVLHNRNDVNKIYQQFRRFPAVPSGDSVYVTMSAKYMSGDAFISAQGTEKFRLPF